VYDVTIDERSQPQIDALPPQALAPFAEARTVLEVAPWNGDSINAADPAAPVRTLAFGQDQFNVGGSLLDRAGPVGPASV